MYIPFENDEDQILLEINPQFVDDRFYHHFEITVILHLVISFQIIPSSRQFTRQLSRISSKSNMRIILRMGCVGVRYRNNDAHL